MNVLLWVPLVALVVSAAYNAYQFYDRQRARRPRVDVRTATLPGSPSWPDIREGQFTDPPTASYIAGIVTVAGSAIITDARLRPATGDAVWEDLPKPDIYVGDPARPDSGRRETGLGIAQIPDEYVEHSLPKPLTDAQLVIRLEHGTLPEALRRPGGARLWIETDTGHRFLSDPVEFSTRFRGPRPGVSLGDTSEIGSDLPREG